MSREVTALYTSDHKHAVWFEGFACGALACDCVTEAEVIADDDDGCCEEYRCPVCGKTFVVEWPD